MCRSWRAEHSDLRPRARRQDLLRAAVSIVFVVISRRLGTAGGVQFLARTGGRVHVGHRSCRSVLPLDVFLNRLYNQRLSESGASAVAASGVSPAIPAGRREKTLPRRWSKWHPAS